MTPTSLLTPFQEQRQSQDDLILAYLDRLSGLLYKYAASAHLDYDDLRQDACLVIMDILLHKPQRTHTLAYMAVTVRCRILDKLRYNKRRQAESLDAPWSPEGYGSFADLLPSSDREPGALLEARETVEAILAGLPPGRWQKRWELAETVLASLSLEDGEGDEQ